MAYNNFSLYGELWFTNKENRVKKNKKSRVLSRKKIMDKIQYFLLKWQSTASQGIEFIHQQRSVKFYDHNFKPGKSETHPSTLKFPFFNTNVTMNGRKKEKEKIGQ